MFDQEAPYYDLATTQGQEQYSAAVETIAATWAANFEEGGGGDGTPYELGQGLDLWIDIVERWDDDFGEEAVSDMQVAEQLGTTVCEQVIITLVNKRN